MNKVIIKTKTTKERDVIFRLITKNLHYKCNGICGYYYVDKRYNNRNDLTGIGVFCEKITLYYNQ